MGKDIPGHARQHSDVSCAKLAEPIDLPFGLWTRVGRRKHTFELSCQVAPICFHGRARHGRPHIAATWRIRLNRTSAAAMRPFVKLLWPCVLCCVACWC